MEGFGINPWLGMGICSYCMGCICTVSAHMNKKLAQASYVIALGVRPQPTPIQSWVPMCMKQQANVSNTRHLCRERRWLPLP